MFSNSPLITTIIPTFRRPERLKKAIRSVLNQNFPSFQLCIYDNNSGDTTQDVVNEFAKYDSRIKYYCHKENVGAIQNFQYGLNKVETPYFSFLADDDFLLPEFYQTALQGFEKYPHAAISSGAVIEMNDKKEILQIPLLSWPDLEYFSAPNGLFEAIKWYSNWSGSLFQTQVVKNIGPLDVGIKAMDVDFFYRISARYPIVISKKPCAVFVSHSTSYSANNGLKLIWPGRLRMIENLNNDKEIPFEVREKAERQIHGDLQRLLFNTALIAVLRQDFDTAFSSASLFFQQNVTKIKKILLKVSIAACVRWKFMLLLLTLLYKLRKAWRKIAKDNLVQRRYEIYIPK